MIITWQTGHINNDDCDNYAYICQLWVRVYIFDYAFNNDGTGGVRLQHSSVCRSFANPFTNAILVDQQYRSTKREKQIEINSLAYAVPLLAISLD